MFKSLAGLAKILRGLLVVLWIQFNGLLEADGGHFGIAHAEQGHPKIIVGTRLIRRFLKRFQRIDIALAMGVSHAQVVVQFR